MTDDDLEPSFVTPIARPLLKGKLLERGLKLLKKCSSWEQSAGEGGKPLKASARQIRRGVLEVTKALRKGEKGLVFIASDVAPLDIIAHLPVYCEDQNVPYAFMASKKALGLVCRTPRPASVLMVCKPRTPNLPYAELFEKLHSALSKEIA